MNLMFNPWAYESKKSPKMSVREKLLLASLPLFLVALTYFGGIHRDKLAKEDDIKGRQEYVRLEKLADIDGNDSLSDVEKKLLCSRIDQNIPIDTSYLARPYREWSYCMSNPPAFFGSEVRTRIEKAITTYESDASRK